MNEIEQTATDDGASKFGSKLMLGVVFGLVVYIAYVLWADVGKIKEALIGFPWALLIVACALSFTNYAIRFARWQRYLKLLDIRVPAGTSFNIYLAGLALTVTPGKMGETFKSWLLKRIDGTSIRKSAPIIVAERFTDLLGFLILIAISGIATEPKYAWVFWATLGLCGALLVLAASRKVEQLLIVILGKLPVLNRLAPRLEGAFESTRILLAPRELLFPTVISALGWSLECLGFWLIASALTTSEISFLTTTYAYALSAVAGAVLIIFPGGLGVTEASMGALLTRAYRTGGVSLELASAKAASATILIRACTLWFAVGVGLIATAIFNRKHKAA